MHAIIREKKDTVPMTPGGAEAPEGAEVGGTCDGGTCEGACEKVGGGGRAGGCVCAEKKT